jgi:hypothetical protein
MLFVITSLWERLVRVSSLPAPPSVSKRARAFTMWLATQYNGRSLALALALALWARQAVAQITLGAFPSLVSVGETYTLTWTASGNYVSATCATVKRFCYAVVSC